MRLSASSPADGRGVAVIGAGIVGACIALALRKRGHRVTLVERDAPGAGCSHGNSGAISAGSVAPLALPGVVASVPRMLRDPEGPLHLPWHQAPRVLPWLLRFVASASPERVQKAAAQLADLHRGAVQAHVTLASEVGASHLLLRRGHLHLYPDEAAASKDALGWALREQHGYVVQRLDRAGIVALEPHIPERYRSGRFLEDHATILDPRAYVERIVQAFVAQGGSWLHETVRSLRRDPGDGWVVQGARQAYHFDQVVVAAGVWSRELLGSLGVALPLESQRGYHVQYEGGADLVSRTVVLADHKIFLTPMLGGLRAGGTVEFGGLRRPPEPRRAAVLHAITTRCFPSLQTRSHTVWMGHRPCMPDSLPRIGAVSRRPGLWLAVGHGHLGLTGAPATAALIAQAMSS